MLNLRRLLLGHGGGSAVEHMLLLGMVVIVGIGAYLLSDLRHTTSLTSLSLSETPVLAESPRQQPAATIAAAPATGRLDAVWQSLTAVDLRSVYRTWGLPVCCVTLTLAAAVWLYRLRQRCRCRRAAAAPAVGLSAQQVQLYVKRQQLLQQMAKESDILLQNRLLARHVMTHDLLVIRPNVGRAEMERLMREHHVRHLVVCDANGAVLGVVSDRDLCGRKGKNARTLMSAPVHAIAPDTAISPAITYLIHEGISCLPVVEDGKLCGIVTTTDLILLFQCTLQLWLRAAHLQPNPAAWDREFAGLVQSRTDPVTGLNNHRGLAEILEMLLAMQKRYGQKFSLARVTAPLPAGPQFDDDAGAQAAKTTTEIIIVSARDSDFVARCQNGDFAIVLTQTDSDGAKIFCARLTVALRRAFDETDGGNLCAAVVEAGDESVTDLLQRSEVALAALQATSVGV